VGTDNIAFIFVPSTLAEGCKGALYHKQELSPTYCLKGLYSLHQHSKHFLPLETRFRGQFHKKHNLNMYKLKDPMSVFLYRVITKISILLCSFVLFIFFKNCC